MGHFNWNSETNISHTRVSKENWRVRDSQTEELTWSVFNQRGTIHTQTGKSLLLDPVRVCSAYVVSKEDTLWFNEG